MSDSFPNLLFHDEERQIGIITSKNLNNLKEVGTRREIKEPIIPLPTLPSPS